MVRMICWFFGWDFRLSGPTLMRALGGFYNYKFHESQKRLISKPPIKKQTKPNSFFSIAVILYFQIKQKEVKKNPKKVFPFLPFCFGSNNLKRFF